MSAPSGKLGTATIASREIDRLEAGKGFVVVIVMALVTLHVIPVVDQDPATAIADGLLGLYQVFFVRP